MSMLKCKVKHGLTEKESCQPSKRDENEVWDDDFNSSLLDNISPLVTVIDFVNLNRNPNRTRELMTLAGGRLYAFSSDA